MPEVWIVTTTVSPEIAPALVEAALTARLAACAQHEPLESRYWWQAGIESAREVRIDFKTTAPRAQALIALLREHHPYAVPEILAGPVAWVESAYAAWVEAETREPG